MRGSFHHAFDILEAIGTAADIEDDALVQEPVEDGGGHGLVSGEDAGPVLDALVGGDGGGAASVAIADEAEEEPGIGPIPEPAGNQAGLVRLYRGLLQRAPHPQRPQWTQPPGVRPNGPRDGCWWVIHTSISDEF